MTPDSIFSDALNYKMAGPVYVELGRFQ